MSVLTAVKWAKGCYYGGAICSRTIEGSLLYNPREWGSIEFWQPGNKPPSAIKKRLVS